MSKKENAKKEKKRKKIRPLYVTLILYLVCLPVILIPAVYISTLIANKPAIFGKTDLTYSKIDDISDFDYEFILTSYTQPTLENGEYSQAGSMKYNEKFTNINVNMYNVVVSYELHNKWYADTSGSSSYTYSYDFIKNAGNEYTRTSNASMSIRSAYPYKPLPLITVKYPTLYVKIAYDVNNIDSIMESKIVYLKIDLKPYIESLKTE